MKRLLAILLTVFLCLALTACGGLKDDEIKAMRNVSYERTELTVTLSTNKSTGYVWDFEIFGDCIKQSINKSFKVTGSQGNATGEASIGFEGLSEGEAVILFTTPNGWDGAGEGDAYTVNVSVNADGTIKSASGENGDTAPEPTSEAALEPTEGTETLLSEPYAEMLKGGDYQYTYSLTYEGAAYTATIAAKNGMFCRLVTADDGSYSARIVTIDGRAWQVDNLTGGTWELSAEEAAAEVQPDYGASLTFAGANTLDTGYIAEAYDFEYQGAKCNIVFVLSPEGELVMLVPTVGENASQMEILEMKASADEALFKAPETSDTVITQNETIVIDGLFDLTLGEASTYDDDMFLDYASSGCHWLGISANLAYDGDERLSIFSDYITNVKLVRGDAEYEGYFAEQNPAGSGYSETLVPIQPHTEVEAFVKFEVPAELTVSDGFTLCFTIGDVRYSCDIR